MSIRTDPPAPHRACCGPGANDSDNGVERRADLMAHACEKLRLRPVGGFGLRRHPQLLPRRDVGEAQHDLDQRHPQRFCNLQLSVGERFGAQADLLPPGLETCARRKARDVGCDVRGLARIAAPDDRAHFFLTEEHNVIARLALPRNGQQSRRIGRVATLASEQMSRMQSVAKMRPSVISFRRRKMDCSPAFGGVRPQQAGTPSICATAPSHGISARTVSKIHCGCLRSDASLAIAARSRSTALRDARL